MIERKLIILLFSLFSIIKLVILLTTCTKNPEYTEITKSNDVTLCDQSGCNIKYLTYDKTYTECTDQKKRGQITFEIIEEIEDNTFTAISCTSTGIWSDAMGCTPANNVPFRAHSSPMTDFQFFSVKCKTDFQKTDQQFPVLNQEFVKILGYDNFLFRGQTVVLLPTLKLTCSSYCMESKSGLVYTSESKIYKNMIDDNDKSVARIGLQILSKKSKNFSLTYACQAANSRTWMIKFYLINSEVTCSLANTRVTVPTQRTTMDAGESIYCFLTADYNNIPYTHGISPINILLFSSSFQRINKPSDNILIVPENLSVTLNYYVNCSLGDVAYEYNPINHIHQYYHLFKTFEIKIKGKFKTEITSGNGEFINDFDIEDNSVIKCNVTYYDAFYKQSNKNIQINIMYSTSTDFPYSNIIDQYDTKKLTSTDNSIVFVLDKVLQTYVYCTIDQYISTPVRVSSGTRPRLTFFDVFPPWPSKYTIKGYVYGCYGNFTTYIEFTCKNCTDAVVFQIKGTDNKKYIIFSEDFLNNNFIVISCIGYSSAYQARTVTKVLQILRLSETKFNDTYSFFMENDNFNCITKITLPNGKTVRIPMPTMLFVNNVTYSTDSQNKFLELVKGKTAYTLYKGCCFPHSFSTPICEWNEVLVAKDYSIGWSRNLESIYPGNTIQCHVCLNYTTSRTNQICTGINKKMEVIGIDTLFPDNSEETITCDDKKYLVKSPLQYHSPDNTTITSMSDQKSTVTCCLKRGSISIKLGLKSCDDYPPDIKIIPMHKSRFVVGETFTCTTDNIDCQQGITYYIDIIKGTNVQSSTGSSYKFKYEDIGNRVNIVCKAGTIRKVRDERVIRLEQVPFNVKISGLYKIMWPGTYLTCLAEGFPRPTISWIQTDGLSPLRISENFLLIGPWDISGDFSITCQAKNKQGVSFDYATFRIFNPEIPERYADSSFYVFIILSMIMFIIVIFASLLLIFQENFFGVPFFSTNVASDIPPRPSRLQDILAEMN